MTNIKTYEGLPFFIGSGTRVQGLKNLALVQAAVRARFRTIDIWRDRYKKGCEIREAMTKNAEGVVKNVNVAYAYNAYKKFLNTSLLSLQDTFRLYTDNFMDDVERPTKIIKGYLAALQRENDLICDDAILYGCAAVLLDTIIDDEGIPSIRINRVRSERLVYDFEQPGVGLFSIRVTPEMAKRFDFLPDFYQQMLYNKAIANATSVAKMQVFVGDLVVEDKLDTYIALIYNEQVMYAERNRTLTYLRAVSINDKNDDHSPIYTILRATELSRDTIKTVFDYSDQVVNPIRTVNWKLSAEEWETAKKTKFLKISNTATNQIQPLLPGQLDINGLLQIQQLYQQLAQQSAGLNEYTLGEASGSVRTMGEAMMLADSASGIMNILANKLKQKLILPVLQDILEILKITLAPPVSDLFPQSLQIDLDIAKDQQETQMLLSIINMPMFGAVLQGLNGIEALQLLRWILEKLHISGTESIFTKVFDNTINNRNTIGNQQQQQNNQQQQQQVQRSNR